jgi:quercetin dioxygenase-like cupin family protein
MIIRHANLEPTKPGKASQFTGRAVGDAVLPTVDGVTINTITFEPGARTHWHEHASGQLLQVVAGYGLVCTSGETPQALRPGDTVWVPAGERHWHGAGPDTFMTHTAISLGATAWSDEVSDSEYGTPPATSHNEGDTNV